MHKYNDCTVVYHDLITAMQVQKLSATLDRDHPVPKALATFA